MSKLPFCNWLIKTFKIAKIWAVLELYAFIWLRKGLTKCIILAMVRMFT